ncbi:helix-turn-helix domain-containing protein [Bradyrhizobium elkanii]|uniref:helix-turn-helix domain-containing protein n=1 Tax=Bradyrhizobium elkanii TaxID=29448 RepID=UPI001FD8ABC2|nr:AraC family transcriptional regulator [Bradyrhizobium elkanii]
MKGDSWYLALHDFIRSDGETTINGGSRSTLTDIRDKLTFLPAGSSAEGWNRFKNRTSTVFAVHFVPPSMDHNAADVSAIPPSLYFESNNLKTTLLKLQSVLDGSGLNDPAYVETLGLVLLWELKHIKDSGQPQTNTRGTLTPTQVKRIRDFVGTDLCRDMTVSDLAAVTGLSQFHFIRAFKEAVGLSPYQYILSERVRRAKELLSMHSLSISEVALAVGFSDNVQLNRVFRRFVGLTPTAFRRSLT